VLMDLQYATALVVPDEKKRFAIDMVARISAAAEKAWYQRVSPICADAALES